MVDSVSASRVGDTLLQGDTSSSARQQSAFQAAIAARSVPVPDGPLPLIHPNPAKTEEGSLLPVRIVSGAVDEFSSAFQEPLGPSKEFMRPTDDLPDCLWPIKTLNYVVYGGGGALLDAAARSARASYDTAADTAGEIARSVGLSDPELLVNDLKALSEAFLGSPAGLLRSAAVMRSSGASLRAGGGIVPGWKVVPNAAPPIVPRVDVTSQFVVQRLRGGSTRLLYGDPDVGHGLRVTVDRRRALAFNIRAPGNREVLGSGKDMFASAMQRLVQERVIVRAITSVWGRESDNFAQYLRHRAVMSPVDAAARTWTGQIATDYGFRDIKIVSDYPGIVRVTFRK